METLNSDQMKPLWENIPGSVETIILIIIIILETFEKVLLNIIPSVDFCFQKSVREIRAIESPVTWNSVNGIHCNYTLNEVRISCS